MRVKGVLLDLDGTIVDSKEAYFEAARTAFATIGRKTVEIRLAMEIPRRLEQYLPLDDIVGGDLRKFLKTYLETYYKVTAIKTKPIPHISDTLKTISEKAKLALITMRYVPKEAVIEELTKFGLAQYFTQVITALDTRNPKPSPEALIKCVKELDVQMCDCVVVGDSVSDIRAGKSAGAKTVAVLSGIFSFEELKKERPDLILETVNQLPNFVE